MGTDDYINRSWEPMRDRETPMGDLDKFSIENWNRIPQEDRDRCVKLLRSLTPQDMLDHWKDQYERGMRVGSDDLFFHSPGTGMQIRNALRSIILDDKLPEIQYQDGNSYQNWDDFYFGAIYEMLDSSIDILYSSVKRND